MQYRDYSQNIKPTVESQSPQSTHQSESPTKHASYNLLNFDLLANTSMGSLSEQIPYEPLRNRSKRLETNLLMPPTDAEL
jgi:hypothetical protein